MSGMQKLRSTMIQEIWMNATEITAEETMDQEVFSIEANEKMLCSVWQLEILQKWKYGCRNTGIFRGAACEASAGLWKSEQKRRRTEP